MTDYKLMPKQITKEMADAFWEEYSKDRAYGLLSRCYRALYAAAPVEQTKPVLSPRTVDTMSTDSNSEQEQFSVINMSTAAPQLVKQQPVGEMISNDGDIYWMNSYPPMGTKLYTATQPAPDVTQLVEALKAAQKEAVYGLNHARTNLQASAALGRVSAITEAALAAYHKGVQI